MENAIFCYFFLTVEVITIIMGLYENNGGRTVMFLNQLNDNEKELYLQLCAYAVMADDVFAADEMESIALICHEMMLTNHMPDTEEHLDSILDKLNIIASRQQKNIMILELMLLLKRDGVLDESEVAFLEHVKDMFEISDEKYTALYSLSEIYLSVYKQLSENING